MLTLAPSAVRTGGTAVDKADAIRQVGAILVSTGNIEPGYVDSMLARERIANTFLGNGIAIPHGIPKDRGLIRETGVAVLQLPSGVEWNPGEVAHLVVGIAARSDEHLEILSNLTDVLSDGDEAARLARTSDAGDIAARLSGKAAAARPKAAPADLAADPVEGFEITIAGPHGLHARPATAFADIAKRFQATIRVRSGDSVADGKSLISLLRLGAGSGASVRIMAEGTDAAAALAALRQAIEAGLEDEAEAAAEAAAAPAIAGTPAIAYQGRTVAALAASPGIAIGPVRQFHRARIVVEVTAKDTRGEMKKLDRALETARRELDDLFDSVWKKSGPQKAGIFRAHAEFLDDPEMIEDTRSRIRDGHSAGWSWQQAYEERADLLAGMKDDVLASRAIDLRDVGRRVLKLLADALEDEPHLPDRPVILIADDLTPSDTARLNPAFALGLCTAGGGPTAHTAIIARSLEIPAVVSAGDGVLDIPDGTPAILDGDSGILVLNPTTDDVMAASRAQVDHRARRDAEKRACYQPAITTDGIRVEVVSNISDVDEAAATVEAGGEGVGLLRTEFLFLQRDAAPSEDEQYATYSAMVKALAGLPLTVRTLDIGGDKDVPYLAMPAEANPFLGERGIRLCLARPELFRTQLRAIFRAAKEGPVRIMYPMIAMVEELREAKSITEAVRREVGADPVEVGMMIEVPSAAMLADQFAREVQFFSIGTNDLTQYVLAMDRLHPQLARQADGLHPAVLRMIDRTVRAADAAGIWVGACGGVAGDPAGAAILIGLGVHELSMSIPSIAAVKARVRALSHSEVRALAGKALACATAAEVRALI